MTSQLARTRQGHFSRGSTCATVAQLPLAIIFALGENSRKKQEHAHSFADSRNTQVLDRRRPNPPADRQRRDPFLCFRLLLLLLLAVRADLVVYGFASGQSEGVNLKPAFPSSTRILPLYQLEQPKRQALIEWVSLNQKNMHDLHVAITK